MYLPPNRMHSLLLWLALSQAPDADAVPLKLHSIAEVEVLPSSTRRQLIYEDEVWCALLKPTHAVPSGRFRVQCSDVEHECLAAPEKVLVDGVESDEELVRTRLCLPLFKDSRLLSKAEQGYRFVEAVAEAPDGWYRDERGRIIQVNFDLHRRVYFGGAWAPEYSPRAGFDLGRGRTDFGIEIDLDARDGKELHRLRILEGSVWIGADPRVDAALIRYSWSAQRGSPLLWISTFVGHPRRFDLDLNVSGWFEALHWELVSGKSFLTLGTAQLSTDLWRSKNLESFLRVRVGPAAEYDLESKSLALKPVAAIDGDFTLDRDGFSHLTAMISGEKLLFDAPVDGRRLNPSRLRLQVGYERIILAINDYPLSLLLDARATWRDDLAFFKPGWDFAAHAGLRFSFWAPARRDAGQVAFH